MSTQQPTRAVRALHREDLPAAVAVLARGMRDNPNHVAAFGSDPERRVSSLHHLFSALFTVMGTTREVIGAVADGTVTGVAAMTGPGRCQPSAVQRGRMAAMLPRLGVPALARVLVWQRVWRAYDPDEPHSHLGPVAVDAHLQGRGIGSQLMRAYARRLDAEGWLGYLETDKPENVTFYERHGFTVVTQEAVLGTPNWFMRRKPPIRG